MRATGDNSRSIQQTNSFTFIVPGAVQRLASSIRPRKHKDGLLHQFDSQRGIRSPARILALEVKKSLDSPNWREVVE